MRAGRFESSGHSDLSDDLFNDRGCSGPREPGLRIDHQTMGDNGDGEFLNLLGSDKFPAIKQSEGLGSLHKRERSAGASPELHAGEGASAGNDFHHVAFDLLADAYLADGALEIEHIRKGDTTGDALEGMALL